MGKDNRDERGHRWFALGYSIFGRLAEKELGRHRSALLSQAKGHVVEIGAGTGLNFRYYPAAVTHVLATEPDPHMIRRARKSASAAGPRIEVQQRRAESLGIAAASVDDVAGTLVLCSVPDQEAALAEMLRVLRPGGRLLFFEHVRSSEPGLARRQDRRERLWMRIAAGCHPNRETERAIRDAGFEIERIEHFDVKGSKLVRPHILGVARKPAT